MSLWSTAATARSGVVGAWRLGESSGTTATDAAGTPHNGTYAGTFTLGKAGVWVPTYSYETSVLMDGSTGRATVADNAALNLTTFTASIYFYPTAAAGASAYRLLFGKTNGIGSAGWFMAIYNGQNLIAFSPTSMGATSNPTVSLNQWHVAHLTRDGTTNLSTLYLDGKAVASATITWAATSAALSIGSNASGTQNFQGNLEEAFLYNRVLSAAEIAFDVGALNASFIRDVDRPLRFNAPAGGLAVQVSDANYTAKPTDTYVHYTALTAGRTFTAPATGFWLGQKLEVADMAGAAGTNSITISGATNGGTISTNYGSATLRWSGTAWVRTT